MYLLVRTLAFPPEPPVYRGLVHIVPANYLQDTSGKLHGRFEGGARVEPLVEVQEVGIRQLEPSLHQV